MTVKAPRPKLTVTEIRTMHALYRQGWGYRRIAQRYGVHYLTVKYHVTRPELDGDGERVSAPPVRLYYRCPGCGGRATEAAGHPHCQEALCPSSFAR